MTYSLSLDLLGADKAESVLSKLATTTQQLKSGGSIFSGTASTSSNTPTAKILTDLDKASHKVAGMKKDFQSIATSFAQGFGNRTMAFLQNLSPANQAKVFATNPGLQAAYQAFLNPVGSVKGLRDVTGKDLAKVFAMGSFNNAISESSKASQGIPPYLKGASSGSVNPSSIPLIGKYLTVIGATTLALDAMHKAIQIASNAINKGFSIYSGAGQSGLSTGFFAQRQALASIFGVTGNPQQVFLFGKAVTDMQQRIAGATQTLARNAPVMAQIHMNLSVLGLDFESFASKVVTEAAPAINLFIGIMDTLVKKMMHFATMLADVAMMWGAGAIIPMMSLMGGKGDINNLLSFMKTPPALHPLMSKLPGSQFESMGLNIGPGTQTTNDLIRQSNRFLSHLPAIANALVPGGVPRANQFGMQANMNQP